MIHVYENPIRYLNARQLYSNIDGSIQIKHLPAKKFSVQFILDGQ